MAKMPDETHVKTPHAEQEIATLLAREERMRLALSAARIYTWDWDISRDLIVWSDGLEKELLIAQAPGDVASVQALVHPDDAELVASRIQSALEGPGDYEAEFRMIRGDGSIRWCSARAIVVRDREGRAVRMVGVDQDVTEKHELLCQTIENEARLRTVYGSLAAAEAASQMGSWDWDIARDRVYVSDAYRRLYGLTNDAIVSHESWLKMIVPEDRDKALRIEREHFKSGTRYDFEFRINHPKLGIRWIATIGQVSRDDSGRATRFTGINIDITERKRREEPRKYPEDPLRRFVETSAAAMAVFDRDMRFIAVSPLFESDFGLPASNVVGRGHYEVLPEVPVRWREVHRRCLAGATSPLTKTPSYGLTAASTGQGGRCGRGMTTPGMSAGWSCRLKTLARKRPHTSRCANSKSNIGWRLRGCRSSFSNRIATFAIHGSTIPLSVIALRMLSVEQTSISSKIRKTPRERQPLSDRSSQRALLAVRKCKSAIKECHDTMISLSSHCVTMLAR